MQLEGAFDDRSHQQYLNYMFLVEGKGEGASCWKWGVGLRYKYVLTV